MSQSGLSDGLFGAFLDWLYASGEIKVPADFHSRCDFVGKMIDNDSTGIVNTILDYAINSASETNYRIESKNKTLESLLNIWLDRINIQIEGVPTGLQQLSKEYFKERWAGSSLCLLRASKWEKITVDNVTIEVPTVLWFVNGSSVYVKRPNEKNYKLGTDEYYLDSNFKTLLQTNDKEKIIIQKPFGRWYDKYPVPYLVKKGVLKNWLTVKTVQEKVDEVVSKILPYLFVIEKGTEEMAKEGITYDDKELKDFVDQFKHMLEKYKIEKGRTPANAVPYDQKYQHLIPDLTNILKQELFNQGYRAILGGLGFIDVIQGITSTRKESVLNPKPFITEVNSGVEGFKNVLMEVINYILERNKNKKDLFILGQYLEIVNDPLRINVEAIEDMIRSGYDRGIVSIQTYVESLGFDFETEKERRENELKLGYEDLFYPHLIQNREDIPDRMDFIPAKPKNVKEDRKKETPEANNFNQAEQIDAVKNITGEVKKKLKCKHCSNEFEINSEDMKVGHVRCNNCDKEYPNTDYMEIDFPGNQPQIQSVIEWIRVRIQNPDNFQKETFRTIWFSEKKGIKAIIGRLKGETTTTVQAVLFDKNKWSELEAQKWAKDRYEKINAYLDFLELEEAKIFSQPLDSNDMPIWKEVELEMAPYEKNTDLPAAVRKHSEEAQTAFRKAFNSAWKQYKDESTAFKVAWSVLKRIENKSK